ncbi:MAG: sulfatase-like hydrolase/transferase [Oscillospiraceae bacterium]|nr:sulfatase-like hydrolase/transferase [Candidatus Equicaccousia limihippi]
MENTSIWAGIKFHIKNFIKGNRTVNRKSWWFLLYFPIAIFWSELILRITTSESFFSAGLFYSLIFSIPAGLFLTVFCTFSKNSKTNRRVALILSIVIFLLFGTQMVYHTCFNKYLILNSVTQGGVGQVTQGGLIEIGFKAIFTRLFPIILLFLPSLYLIVFKTWFPFIKTSWVQKGIGLVLSGVIKLLCILLVIIIPSQREIYYGAFNPDLTVENIGMLETEIKDIKYNIFGVEQNVDISLDTDNTSSNTQKETPAVYGKNIMNIDFAALAANEKNASIKSLHQYFGSRQGTSKNAYTGKFKDYNLIMMTCEGFYPFAIQKDLTPTLYKMKQEGFNFTNYYNSPWTVSTSDGEYVECTGLIPKSGVWSFYETGKNNIFLPFTMGQQFLNIGTPTVYAYHNNTYSYYHRDVSHPNLGYLYRGKGNGLNVRPTWPESDDEMIELSVGDYINSTATTGKPFHAYYMTVSGHMEYDWENNYMSYKYKDLVKNLPYSDKLKAYIACNIDLDRALARLLSELEKAGVADKTLIAMSPDHTPYGLELTGGDKYKLFDEIFGHKVETQFEVNRSEFLLYSPSMEKGEVVDKVCSPLDIIPTLNNLLGFEYDSRLLPGNDIFDPTTEGVAIFENHSFITDKGRYWSKTGEFKANAGVTIENQDEYIKAYKKDINNKFNVCAKIIETNYYKKALPQRTFYKGKLSPKS